MCNINGFGDCRELREISQQRYVSQTERFRTKNALDVWKHMRVWKYVIYDEASQIWKEKSNGRRRTVWQSSTCTTNTVIGKGTIVSEKPSITGITLIEIYNNCYCVIVSVTHSLTAVGGGGAGDAIAPSKVLIWWTGKISEDLLKLFENLSKSGAHQALIWK